MTDEKFWDIVAHMGWDLSNNYDATRKTFAKNYTKRECEEFCTIFSDKKAELSKAVEVYLASPGYRSELSLGDDGYSDLLCHIIGLGRKEYEYAIRQPYSAWNRAKAGDYRESFSYCIPSPDECLPDTKTEDLKDDVCPVCGCADQNGDEYNTGENTITQELYCPECDSEWTNTYTLSECLITADRFQKPEEPKEETLSIKQSLGKAIHLIQVFQTEGDVDLSILENSLHHLSNVSEAIDAMDELMGDE
jgi:hypothetical protein